MKIISWNINGIRALHKKELLLPFIKKQNPDILCLQETRLASTNDSESRRAKANETQLSEEIRVVDKYHAYFSSSEVKKGYSGVAVYTKEQPKKVEYGIGIEKFDKEGRILVLYFKDFVLLNVYFPNGGMGPERLKYKMDFYDAFLKYVEKLRKKPPPGGAGIIFCGDVNTAHEEIDLARPKANEKHTGFLPIERLWITQVIKKGYVDIFRHFYPDKKEAYTYWDMKSRARDRNVGWRIDYFFVSKEFVKNVKSTEILSDIMGSDHCPIELTLK